MTEPLAFWKGILQKELIEGTQTEEALQNTVHVTLKLWIPKPEYREIPVSHLHLIRGADTLRSLCMELFQYAIILQTFLIRKNFLMDVTLGDLLTLRFV